MALFDCSTASSGSDTSATASTTMSLHDDLKDEKIASPPTTTSAGLHELFFEESPDLHCVLSEPPCGTEGTTPSLRFDSVNKAWMTLLGYPKEELLGKCLADFLHPEDEGKVTADTLVQRHDKDEDDNEVICEARFRHSDGVSYRWLSWTGNRCIWQKHTLLLASARDITKAKTRQLACLATKRRLQESHEIAKLGQWDLDLTTNTLYWSSYIYQLFQICPKKFGASYEAFLNAIHPEDRDKVNAAYLLHLETKQPYEIIHRLLLPDSTVKWVIENCRSEYDSNGLPLRSIGTVQDITELKQAQEELRIAKDKAEEADSLKSAFLANMSHEIRTPMNAVIGFTDLMLSETDESDRDQDDQDSISAGRTALCAVSASNAAFNPLFSSSAPHQCHCQRRHSTSSAPHQCQCQRPYSRRQQNRKKDHLEYLETIKSSGKLLLTLINDILDISKIEAGQFELEDSSFSLGDVLRTVEYNAMGIISRSGHAIRFKTFTTHHSTIRQSLLANQDDNGHALIQDTIVGDPNRLQQVLNNLLSNAIKFTSSGTVEWNVRIIAHPSDSSRQMLEFTVSDTGTGIPLDMQEHIFEPFRQVKNKGGSNNCITLGGTGLGLAIAKKLVERMGGNISLESSMDETTHGSIFRFTIPYKPAVDVGLATTAEPNNHNNKAQQQQQQPTAAAPKRNASASPSKYNLPALSGTILVVDDNRVNLKLADRLVSKFGCQTETAENGQIAVEKYRTSLSLPPTSSSKKINVILMDKSMPVMDGMEAVRLIREMEAAQNLDPIPIIALTAAAMGADRDECLAAGCDGYITKPLNRGELHENLAKYLQISVGIDDYKA